MANETDRAKRLAEIRESEARGYVDLRDTRWLLGEVERLTRERDEWKASSGVADCACGAPLDAPLTEHAETCAAVEEQRQYEHDNCRPIGDEDGGHWARTRGAR